MDEKQHSSSDSVKRHKDPNSSLFIENEKLLTFT
jgi:hypothetical protein